VTSVAQTTSDNSGAANQSWSSSTQQSDPSGTQNPTRITASHVESDGRTIDKQSVQGLSDGRYQPYLDVETESVRVDAETVKTVRRSYARNPDGQRTLTQVTEEEKRGSANGEQKITRSTSNPDANGNLQVISREVEDSIQVAPGIRNISTTLLAPDSNGGFSAVSKSEQREARTGEHTVEYKKSTSLPDGNGGWQVSEIRQGKITGEGKDRSVDETVLRPDLNGSFAVTDRTVTKQSQNEPGEKKQTVESYSTNLPGAAPDGRLQLTQRATTVQRSGAGGVQTTEQEVQQPVPADPGAGLTTTQKVIDIVRPGVDNTKTESRTIQSRAPSGRMDVVWVDTANVQSTPSVQVDTKKSSKNNSVKLSTGAKAASSESATAKNASGSSTAPNPPKPRQ